MTSRLRKTKSLSLKVWDFIVLDRGEQEPPMVTNKFPANIDRRELNPISLICKIKRRVTLLAPESVAANSLQLEPLFLKVVLVSRRGLEGKGMQDVIEKSRGQIPLPYSFRHQVPTPDTFQERLTLRAAAGRAPTQTHARAPRPRARTRPEAPAAATGTRAVLLPPRRSLRWDRGASVSLYHSTRDPRTRRRRPWSVDSGGVQQFRRRRREGDAAELGKSPGGDVAGRGPLRKPGAATGRPVRRRRGRS